MFSDQKGHLLIWCLKGKDLFGGKSLYYLESELFYSYYLFPQRGGAWGILDGRVTVTLGQGGDSKGPVRQQGGCWRVNGRGKMELWSILKGPAGLISRQQPQAPQEQEQGSGHA